ncbi:MAG: 5-(carboxyamino)imidazole ribonucleotide mutase [Acidobacteria bacterium RIFCSPLOWO2_12_FULL_54_10]|nr:MAG: 5-(carboxyamino)imidazole ribonucleotide mutase [Acidobacteria bacterium RIFCSPLOWO2_12_FULL_54_10]
MPKKKTVPPLVAILMGSDSDLPVMSETAHMLKEFGIPFELVISSAHRTPARTAEFARAAAGRGIKVIVAGAGGAFHLAGVIAAETTLPVIAVPLAIPPLNGFDSLLAAVQMPCGVPVGTMAVGKAGAVNAGIFCAQILATSDESLRRKLEKHKKKMAQSVIEKSERAKKEFPS